MNQIVTMFVLFSFIVNTVLPPAVVQAADAQGTGITAGSPVKVIGTMVFGRKVSISRKYALRGHMECLSRSSRPPLTVRFLRFSRKFNMFCHLYRAGPSNPPRLFVEPDATLLHTHLLLLHHEIYGFAFSAVSHSSWTAQCRFC